MSQIDFPELQRVDFKGMRFYKTPQKNHYPSITTILGTTAPAEKQESLKNWQNSLGVSKAAQVTKAAAERGTNVHLLIERYLKKEDLQLNTFNWTDVNAFKALTLKLNNIEKVIGQEVALYSDIIEVAGTCDCVGVYRNHLSIIDFKTSSRLKSEKDIFDYKLQCTFYGSAFYEMFGIEIETGVILMTADTGFPMEFTFQLKDYLQPLLERVDKFYDTLNKSL